MMASCGHLGEARNGSRPAAVTELWAGCLARGTQHRPGLLLAPPRPVGHPPRVRRALGGPGIVKPRLVSQTRPASLVEVVLVTEAAIADHGLVGDLHTAALISTDGSVDWFCCPRFDSPSVFGALLDDARGGHFRVRPAGGAYESKQMYFPDSAALITRFFTADGVGEVVDFMPVLGREVTANHRLVRMVRCVRGRMRFEVDIAPRFDYGRRAHRTDVTENGVVFSTDTLTLTLHAVREPDDARLAQAQVDEGDVRATIDLVAGQVRGVMLESAADGPPREVRPAEVWRLFDDTVAFWQSWLGQSTYRGRWREVVNRSAITLKLMTYAPTGGLVAAPTAALPEQVGGERNWDYRYTWVRDASFSVGALLSIGFVDEAEQFGVWLGDRIRERVGGESGPLNIMYRVDGSSDLKEEVLEHWSGYRGSRPVRIGNGAADQLQLDIYGEAMDSIFAGHRGGLQVADRGWTGISNVLDWLAANWDQPEEGIWETRGGRQAFTYGRLMSWVALDRGVRMADRPGPTRPAGGLAAGTGPDLPADHGPGLARRSAERSCSTTTPTSSTPRCCACPRSGSSHPGTRCGWRPWTPWTTSWSPTASSTATTRRPHRTGCGARRARSRCAPSPTSTRSPAPAGWRRPGRRSRRCSPTPTTSACTPRRSR